jgi:hypothetical protein
MGSSTLTAVCSIVAASHMSHNSPDWSTIAAVSASIVAAIALAFTAMSTSLARRAARAGDRSALAAERAAAATEEYVKIEQQLRVEANQPRVWMDVRPDETNGVILNLVIGNSGPTVAQNVRATIEPHSRRSSNSRIGQRQLRNCYHGGSAHCHRVGPWCGRWGKDSTSLMRASRSSIRSQSRAMGLSVPFPRSLTSSTCSIGKGTCSIRRAVSMS